MPSNSADDVRALIEDIRARHGEYYFSRIEPMGNYCNSCGHEWPCDAARLADMLEQAVTALDAVERDTYGAWATDPDAWMDGIRETAHAALRECVKALEWYADRENYRCFDDWTGSPVDNDEGKRARNALRSVAGGE